MNLNKIRNKIYSEVYARHAHKSKIAKEMNTQPIDNWSQNPYLKLKYYLIIELTALISLFCLKLKIHPNIITFTGVIFALISFLGLSSTYSHLNVLALILFFLKNIFDYADGFVARVSKKHSAFGAFFDEWSGDLFTFCFYFSFPIYVFNKTQNIFFLYLLVFLFFLKITNPKNKIMSENYLKKQSNIIKKQIINIFLKIEYFKKHNFKKNLKNKLIVIFSKLDFDGRTRYTDFLVLVIISEIYMEKVILSQYICILWALVSLMKNFYFFKKLAILKTKK